MEVQVVEAQVLGLLVRISGLLAAPTATAGANNCSCSDGTKSDASREAVTGDPAGQTTSEPETWSEHHTWRDLEKTAGGRQALWAVMSRNPGPRRSGGGGG